MKDGDGGVAGKKGGGQDHGRRRARPTTPATQRRAASSGPPGAGSGGRGASPVPLTPARRQDPPRRVKRPRAPPLDAESEKRWGRMWRVTDHAPLARSPSPAVKRSL